MIDTHIHNYICTLLRLESFNRQLYIHVHCIPITSSQSCASAGIVCRNVGESGADTFSRYLPTVVPALWDKD